MHVQSNYNCIIWYWGLMWVWRLCSVLHWILSRHKAAFFYIKTWAISANRFFQTYAGYTLKYFFKSYKIFKMWETTNTRTKHPRFNRFGPIVCPWCSAFNQSKCTHTQQWTHTVNTHLGQWAAILLQHPGSSLGFSALLKGLVVVLKVKESAIHSKLKNGLRLFRFFEGLKRVFIIVRWLCSHTAKTHLYMHMMIFGIQCLL